MQIMDTPRPEQVRPLRPEADTATEEDCLELMEMILVSLSVLLVLTRCMQAVQNSFHQSSIIVYFKWSQGALGRDAIGLGASMAHPRESSEWQGMSLMQKYEVRQINNKYNCLACLI